jgi:signal transduction histidine kinase/DNA-binding response OmpR family regulator
VPHSVSRTADPRDSPATTPSVLVVDDRPENLLAMEAALEPLGVQVVRADSPQQALDAARRQEFAVILLDVRMPGMDGYEVARRMKMAAGGTRLSPIIFITALDQDRRHVHTGYESGAVDYLFKPLDLDVLRAKVRAFVRLHAEREAEVWQQRRRYADLSDAAAELAARQRAAQLQESASERSRAEAERERLLRELETQRARLANVFRHAPAFLAVLRGPHHVFELANDAFHQLVGHRELIGKPAFEALPDVRGQGFEAILDGVFQTGEPYIGREVAIQLQRTPGAPPESRFLDFAYLPLVEADGTRSGVVAYGLDVTDHVLARQEVERARDRIARLQGLTAALAGANTTQEVADVVVAQGVAAAGAASGTLALRTTQRPGELTTLRALGLPEEVRLRWERFPAHAPAPAAAAVRTGESYFLESHEDVCARFGELADLWARLGTQALASVPLTVAGETVGAMTFTFTAPRAFPPEDRDFFLTLARQAALALERARLFGALTREREAALAARTEAEAARVEAEAAAAAKGQFLATMSHELRTPINAQIGYTQLLDMGVAGPLTAEQRDYLSRLGRSSSHLLGLINDILDFSKIEAGQLTVQPEEGWTGTAMDAALDLARPLADARALRLVDERPGALGVAYVGDEQRVRQVLVNLLSNAVKFTEPGGTITLRCGTVQEAPAGTALHGGGPWAFVKVTDTGIGISLDQFPRIFEPFHQVESGHTRRQGGTGLGLAISRRLARVMGGDLTADSTLGGGSTFTLWLPATAAAVSSGSGGDAAGPDAPLRESASERRARATPESAPLPATGLDRVGEALRRSTEEILAAYVDRLCHDPDVPQAHTMARAKLEDHGPSLLADVAQSLAIVADARASDDASQARAIDALHDGGAIQRAIAEQHGARRHAQGWSEAALRRDHQIFREEIERAVRARAQRAEGDAEAAVQALLRLLDQAESHSLRAWRRAAERAAPHQR